MIPALLVIVATASTSVDASDCANIYNGAIVCVEKARAYKRRVSELELELATRPPAPEGAAEDSYSLGTVIMVAICAAALGAGVGAVAAVAAAH